MNSTEFQQLKEDGFTGFKTVKELKCDMSSVPAHKGVYVVLRENDGEPKFVETGTGGFFKGNNPNVSISELNKNWVKASSIMYMGKAGGQNNNATLNSRLEQYMKFGNGQRIGHWGGRYIWQLEDADELVVCWKETEEDPREVEKRMIEEFKNLHGGCRPFANLTD